MSIERERKRVCLWKRVCVLGESEKCVCVCMRERECERERERISMSEGERKWMYLLHKWKEEWVYARMYMCVCVCVVCFSKTRERERERCVLNIHIYKSFPFFYVFEYIWRGSLSCIQQEAPHTPHPTPHTTFATMYSRLLINKKKIYLKICYYVNFETDFYILGKSFTPYAPCDQSPTC